MKFSSKSSPPLNSLNKMQYFVYVISNYKISPRDAGRYFSEDDSSKEVAVSLRFFHVSPSA